MTFQGSPTVPAPLALDASASPRADSKPEMVGFHHATNCFPVNHLVARGEGFVMKEDRSAWELLVKK